jgi:Uma2 family endonuclease
MSTAARVSLEEYLRTEYHPDCDYVDGVLEDRNVGKQTHGETQAAVAAFFHLLRKRLGIRVATELRMRVSATRVRIPDVAIVDAQDVDEVKQNPPLLCIEILSPDDRFSRVLKIVDEYLAFGVPMIWIVDPYNREAFVITQEEREPRPVNQLRWNDIVVELSEILPD